MNSTEKVALGTAIVITVVGGSYLILENVKAKAQTTASLTLAAQYITVSVNESDSFTVTASGLPNGTGVTLWVSYNGGAWASVGTQQVANGSATFTWTPTQVGTYYFQANAGGSSS